MTLGLQRSLQRISFFLHVHQVDAYFLHLHCSICVVNETTCLLLRDGHLPSSSTTAPSEHATSPPLLTCRLERLDAPTRLKVSPTVATLRQNLCSVVPTLSGLAKPTLWPLPPSSWPVPGNTRTASPCLMLKGAQLAEAWNCLVVVPKCSERSLRLGNSLLCNGNHLVWLQRPDLFSREEDENHTKFVPETLRVPGVTTSYTERARPPAPGSPRRSRKEVANAFASEQDNRLLHRL